MGPEVMLIGAGLSAIGQIQQSKGQQRQYAASAAAADYNAKVAEMEGASEAARIRRESSRRVGAIRAGISKSGVTSQGTPMVALAESAAMGELDAMTAMWSATNEANLYRGTAESNRMARRTAKSALPFAVGSSLLTGAGNYSAAGGTWGIS